MNIYKHVITAREMGSNIGVVIIPLNINVWLIATLFHYMLLKGLLLFPFIME